MISWPYGGSFQPHRLFEQSRPDHCRKYHPQKLCGAFSVTELALASMKYSQIPLKQIDLNSVLNPAKINHQKSTFGKVNQINERLYI